MIFCGTVFLALVWVIVALVVVALPRLTDRVTAPFRYLEDAIDAQRAAGHPVSDDAISHLSPGHYEPINPYGTLNFDVANVVERPRRPLRGA